MNFLLLFFIFGAASCFPQDMCCKEALDKCVKFATRRIETEIYLESVQDVDTFCEDSKCLPEYKKWCSKAETIKYFRKTVVEKYRSALCDAQGNIRKKYFDNVRCLIQVKNDNPLACGAEGTDHDTFCKNLDASYQCSQDLVAKTCGQDAVEVFVALYTSYEFFDCPPPQ